MIIKLESVIVFMIIQNNNREMRVCRIETIVFICS